MYCEEPDARGRARLPGSWTSVHPHPEDPVEPVVVVRPLRALITVTRGREHPTRVAGVARGLTHVGLPGGRCGRRLHRARRRREDDGGCRLLLTVGERGPRACGGNHRKQDQQEQESSAFRKHLLPLPPRLVAVQDTTQPSGVGAAPDEPELEGTSCLVPKEVSGGPPQSSTPTSPAPLGMRERKRRTGVCCSRPGAAKCRPAGAEAGRLEPTEELLRGHAGETVAQSLG
jgi:hypothetical protein